MTSVTVTFFDDYAARRASEHDCPLDELAELIRTTRATAKDHLPWLKCARFGDRRTPKGSLRNDANVVEITGIETDHDAETVKFYKAEAIAQSAGLQCILYTSPSHRPDKPRWRILAPLSRPCPPAERSKFLNWLHGLFSSATDGGDVFAGESWTLSQSYYYGAVGSGPHHRVVVVHGAPVDQLDHLGESARGKPQTKSGGGRDGGGQGSIDEAALLELIQTGANYHNSAIRLIGYWASQGLSYTEADAKIRAAFNVVEEVRREDRWRDRVDDLPNLLAHVYGREAERQTARDRNAGDFEDDHPPPGSPPPPRRRFRLVRFANITFDTSPRCIVEDLIPADALVVIWGPPKCGKTFFVLDLMMHVALGWEYRGRRVQAGPVIYVAAEGERGIKARVEAFRQAKIAEAGHADPPFYLLTTPLDLVGDLDMLITDIAAGMAEPTCSIIVIDTLNRTLRGSESRDEDMSAYRAAADRLREVFSCTVVLIHHCGVNGDRPRGHTSLTGAIDAQLAVKRDAAGNVIVILEWMKDGGGEGEQLASRLVAIEIGEDGHGKLITSCIVEPVEGDDMPPRSAVKPKKLPAGQQRAFDMLTEAIITAGEVPPASNHIPAGRRCVKEQVWRRYCYQGGISDGQQNARRMAFTRAAEMLLANRHIGCWDGWIWPA